PRRPPPPCGHAANEPRGAGVRPTDHQQPQPERSGGNPVCYAPPRAWFETAARLPRPAAVGRGFCCVNGFFVDAPFTQNRVCINERRIDNSVVAQCANDEFRLRAVCAFAQLVPFRVGGDAEVRFTPMVAAFGTTRGWKWSDHRLLENHVVLRVGGLRGTEVTVTVNGQIQVVQLEQEWTFGEGRTQRRRPWFRCPVCDRRTRTLHEKDGNSLVCRLCSGYDYRSRH